MDLRNLLEISSNALMGLTTLEKPDFRLEQAEFDRKGKAWDVVISFLVENTNKPTGSTILPLTQQYQFHRLYKRLRISDKGEVLGYYMYEK